MSAATVTSDGSPFSRENTPAGAPEPKMSLPHDNNRAWAEGGGEGGCQGEEMKLDGGGGGGDGRKKHFFFLKNKKN
jgi:hypothetical protein